MCNQDLIIEKIQNLSEKIDSTSDNTRRELDAMNSHLSTINGNIASLSTNVREQNGRVSSLEATQKSCPGKIIANEFHKYESDMKPVYILSTNYKLIAFLVLGAALAFRVIDLGLGWLFDLLSI